MPTKNTPLAKALRTFAALMAGPLAAATVYNWFGGDVKAGATRLTLAVIAAVVGGGLAYLTALTPQNPTSPAGKAIATFLQGVVAGAATLVVADLTSQAAVVFAQALGAVVVSSLLAALGSLAVNAAEDKPPVPAPPPQG